MLRVSVVTPSYNQASFLVENLASVAAQGPVVHEHIVADGGSTDGSREVLERSTVRWVSERDRGQSDALNKALRLATGDVIGWLNSDDIYRPGAAARAAQILEDDPSLMGVFGHCDVIDEQGRTIGLVEGVPVDLEAMLCFGTIPQPSCFLRRSLFTELGGVDESYRYAMDYDFWLRALLSGAKFRSVDEVWAGFRVHGASKTGGESDRFFPEIIRAMEAALASPRLPSPLAARRGELRRRFFTSMGQGAYANLHLPWARRFAARALAADPLGLDRRWLSCSLKSLLPLPAVRGLRRATASLRAARSWVGPR